MVHGDAWRSLQKIHLCFRVLGFARWNVRLTVHQYICLMMMTTRRKPTPHSRDGRPQWQWVRSRGMPSEFQALPQQSTRSDQSPITDQGVWDFSHGPQFNNKQETPHPVLSHWAVSWYPSSQTRVPSQPILNQFNPSQFSTHPFPFSPNQLTSCTGPLSRPRVGTLVSPFKPYLWFGQIFPEVHEDEVDNEYDIDDDLWRQPGRIQLWGRFGLLQGDRVDRRTFVTVPAQNDNDYTVMGIMSHIIWLLLLTTCIFKSSLALLTLGCVCVCVFTVHIPDIGSPSTRNRRLVF